MNEKLERLRQTTDHFGYFPDVKKEGYFAIPAFSSSGAKEILKSPSHFYEMFVNSIAADPTPAKIFGTNAHLALLEPEEFELRVYAKPEFSGAGARAKDREWLTTIPANAIVMKEDDLARVRAMVAKAKDHPLLQKVLYREPRSGVVEVPGTFRHRGIACKFVPDFRMTGGFLFDYKTTADASHDAFQRSAWNYQYHVQAAFYLLGAEAIDPGVYQKFVFIAQESKPPYEIAIYTADEQFIEIGQQWVARAFTRLEDALSKDYWPGYTVRARDLAPPNYAFYAGENDVDE